MNYAKLYWIGACTLAILLVIAQAVHHRPRPDKRNHGAGTLAITDVSAMRLTPQRTEKLSVFRVVANGEATVLEPQPPAAASVIRVDVEVEGKHFSVWIREREAHDPAGNRRSGTGDERERDDVQSKQDSHPRRAMHPETNGGDGLR